MPTRAALPLLLLCLPLREAAVGVCPDPLSLQQPLCSISCAVGAGKCKGSMDKAGWCKRHCASHCEFSDDEPESALSWIVAPPTYRELLTICVGLAFLLNAALMELQRHEHEVHRCAWRPTPRPIHRCLLSAHARARSRAARNSRSQPKGQVLAVGMRSVLEAAAGETHI